MPRSRTLIAAVALCLLAPACGSEDGGADSADDGGGTPAGAVVMLEAATFDPEKVEIKTGETVRWVWEGNVEHDVSGEGFKSEIKSTGDFEHTFEAAGSFPFMCNVHPATMKGTVEVS